MNSLETMARSYCAHSQSRDNARESIERLRRGMAVCSDKMGILSDDMTQQVGARTHVVSIDQFTGLVMFWDSDCGGHHIEIVKR